MSSSEDNQENAPKENDQQQEQDQQQQNSFEESNQIDVASGDGAAIANAADDVIIDEEIEQPIAVEVATEALQEESSDNQEKKDDDDQEDKKEKDKEKEEKEKENENDGGAIKEIKTEIERGDENSGLQAGESQEVTSSTKNDVPAAQNNHHSNHNSQKFRSSMRGSSNRRSSYTHSRHGYLGQNYGLTYLPYKSNFEPSESARRKADEFLKTLKL